MPTCVCMYIICIYACICHLVLNAEKCSVRTTGKVLHVSQGAPVHVELIDSQRRRRRRRRETTMTTTGTRTCHGYTLARGSCAYAYGEARLCICIWRAILRSTYVGWGTQVRAPKCSPVKFKCDANVAGIFALFMRDAPKTRGVHRILINARYRVFESIANISVTRVVNRRVKRRRYSIYISILNCTISTSRDVTYWNTLIYYMVYFCMLRISWNYMYVLQFTIKINS